MSNFVVPLLGGMIGGGIGFLITKIVERLIRAHIRIETEHDDDLALILEFTDEITTLATKYWVREYTSGEDEQLEAAILGRTCSLDSLVTTLFSSDCLKKDVCARAAFDFHKSVSGGAWRSKSRTAEPERLHMIESFSAKFRSLVRVCRRELPREFWSG